MCIAMCMDMCMDMGIGMCIGMCMGMRMGMRMDMCMDTRIDTCARRDQTACSPNRLAHAQLQSASFSFHLRHNFWPEFRLDQECHPNCESADLFFLSRLRGHAGGERRGAGSSRRVASERSRWDASLGTLRSTSVLGVRRRHAPRCCGEKRPRSASILEDTLVACSTTAWSSATTVRSALRVHAVHEAIII